MKNVAEYWFRYDGTVYDEGCVHIYCSEHRVVRRTPKGVWLDAWGIPRFVLNHSRKRWAYPTKTLAFESFCHRKRRQVQHLARQHGNAVQIRDEAYRMRVGLASTEYEAA
jgi:hypothetical protein